MLLIKIVRGDGYGLMDHLSLIQIGMGLNHLMVVVMLEEVKIMGISFIYGKGDGMTGGTMLMVLIKCLELQRYNL